jgi:dethiobiotin synthetase
VLGAFVTGTDTGVGKTTVACALARLLAERGVTVRPRKPIESGCAARDGRPFPADAAALRAAARSNEALAAVCPYPLAAPLAPPRAAVLAGQTITLADLERACRAGVGAEDFLLIEGAGGFLSPLAADARVADLATRLRLPMLLVVADRVGCLNHALLTVEALRVRGLTLAAVLLNRIAPDAPAGMDNAADLAQWLGQPITHVGYAGGGDPLPAVQAALRPLAAALAHGGLPSA